MKVLFVSDFFTDSEVFRSMGAPGGAELNDLVLVNHLLSDGFDVQKKRSAALRREDIQETDFIILSNFVGLSLELQSLLVSDGRYIVYEHDHKYVSTRDPSKFEDFKIPSDKLVNIDLYKNAAAVVVLGRMQRDLILRHLPVYPSNCHSIGTSLWDPAFFKKVRELQEVRKTREAAIVDSSNPIKRTKLAIEFAKREEIPFSLIRSESHFSFLEKLAERDTLIFFPSVLESMSRLYLEARMLGMSVITKTNLIGACYEDPSFVSMKGLQLIEEVESRVGSALSLFSNILNTYKGSSPGTVKYIPMSLSPENQYTEGREKKSVAFIGKFKKIHDEEGKARALERQGLNVIRYDESTFERGRENSMKTLFGDDIEAIFFTKLRVPNAKVLLDLARGYNIKTVSWNPDLYFGLPREVELSSPQKNPIFDADYVLTPDGGNDADFKALGINHNVVRQAIDFQTVGYSESEKDIDILFVGSCDPVIHGTSRQELIRFLQITYGDRFLWVGKDDSDHYRGDDLTDLIGRSKIVIGESAGLSNCWSNRVYETLGRRGFVLHVDISGISEEFEIGKHIDVYPRGNHRELKRKVDFYLKNEKTRERIAYNGFKYVQENHTLDNRAKQVLEIIGVDA